VFDNVEELDPARVAALAGAVRAALWPQPSPERENSARLS